MVMLIFCHALLYTPFKELEPNDLIFMDQFNLQEAMTALQVHRIPRTPSSWLNTHCSPDW